jgi:tetratricopeptide (TPR) repeat protein
VHLAQALLKAGKHADAAKAALQVSGQQHSLRMLQLQATAKYEQDDLAGAKALVDKCVQHEPDTLVARGCLLFKEGAVEQARLKFTEALNAVGEWLPRPFCGKRAALLTLVFFRCRLQPRHCVQHCAVPLPQGRIRASAARCGRNDRPRRAPAPGARRGLQNGRA